MVKPSTKHLKWICDTWFHHGVSPLTQLRELMFFRRVMRVAPLEFYAFRLWDRKRPLEERLAFLTKTEHRDIERALNPKAAVKALNDKQSSALRLRRAGIPMPRALGTIQLQSATGAERSVEDIAADLQSIASADLPHGLVLKPNAGQNGRDILFFSAASSTGLLGMDGESVSFSDLATQLVRLGVQSWNAEERLVSHPALARIAGNKLLSLRVLTLRAPDGNTHVGPISLKIPKGRNLVDNFQAGNMCAPVDPATGKVGLATLKDMKWDIAVHPDTGEQIAGIVIPDLDLVKSIAVKAAAEFRELPSLGWDIVLAPNGPQVLEGNAWWGELTVQMPQKQGLLRDEFARILQLYGLQHLFDKRRRALTDQHLNA